MASAFNYSRILQTTIFISLLLVQTSDSYGWDSKFVRVNLPRSISVEIPKGWVLLGSDINQMIQTTAEAIIDLSGIALPEGRETNILAARAMPKTAYAAVRIDSTIPPSATRAQHDSATAADISNLKNMMRDNMSKILASQGLQLLEWISTRKDNISGFPTIVNEYRRSSAKGPVYVQINQIFTPYQEIRINLSYRESEVTYWKPVIAKIRKSFVAKR